MNSRLPKSPRLRKSFFADLVRKRVAVRGADAVDVKVGDAVQAVTTGWEVENFVKLVEVKKPRRKAPVKKKPAAKKSVAKKAPAKKSAAKKTTSRKTIARKKK